MTAARWKRTGSRWKPDTSKFPPAMMPETASAARPSNARSNIERQQAATSSESEKCLSEPRSPLEAVPVILKASFLKQFSLQTRHHYTWCQAVDTTWAGLEQLKQERNNRTRHELCMDTFKQLHCRAAAQPRSNVPLPTWGRETVVMQHRKYAPRQHQQRWKRSSRQQHRQREQPAYHSGY